MQLLGFITTLIAHFNPRTKSKPKRKIFRKRSRKRAMGVVVESLRYSTIVLSAANTAILILGGCLAIVGSSACGDYATLPFAGVMVAAAARIVVMINIGIAQDASAKTILQSQDTYAVDAVIRHKRRLRYIKWIWWTRIASVITLLQFVGATYLLAHIYQAALQNETGSNCLLGIVSKDSRLEQDVLIVFVIMVSFVAITQCFAGSDVLRWRSFYASEDNAWRAHYREVFDVGMREALCCLGRVKYWSVLEEDEVYSVARVLGDLVAYRASGTGHLELLTGLALFQRCDSSSTCNESLGEAPRGRVEEAAALHKFAEAAYTGPLLDVGRNPLLFPCVWLYRQGILTPWSRNRRPKLKGDNWWRGHAAAFLKYLDLPPETLRKGRICQGRCEAAYFIVALHYLRTVVITVRGTETPEDLITDGLCKECPLLLEDLDGLIKSNHISLSARQAIESSFPHYGHSGIVEAARDLFSQIEGNPEDGSKDVECTSGGFLSSLLGPGGECEGYNLRIVGHSLGGAIASMLGLRLYHRYPNLHVYAYGSLPSVDSAVADACSEFITSIIYDNEFSARLSVGSVLRLRAASLTALSQDQKTDSALIPKLARQFLLLNKYQANRIQTRDPLLKFGSEATMPGQYRQYSNDSQDAMEQGKDLLLNDNVADGTIITIDENNLTSHLNHDKSEIGSSFDDPISRFMETVPTTENASVFDPPELFLPGLIVHIVPQKNEFTMPVWRSWKFQETPESFKVYIANKDNFKDLVVSPSMFLDHLPWRCRYALDKIVANQRSNLRSV